ncbi:hypothetical protein [Pseudomonas putida]
MSETEEQEDQGAEVQEPIDEKEQLLQRRLARIEEALGLSPLN